MLVSCNNKIETDPSIKKKNDRERMGTYIERLKRGVSKPRVTRPAELTSP